VPPPDPIRVLVVDDQTLVREGLASILAMLPGIALVATAADGEEALAAVARHRPDVVLMDLRMPRLDGVEATARIAAEHPTTRVVVLTTFADDASVRAAIRAGASGYLTKDAGADQLRAAIEAASAGAAALDPTVLRSLAAPPPPAPAPDNLTPREIEVLRLIAGGLSNDEIAARLVVAEATVKTHVNNIFAKIGARDRAQAVAYAFRTGLSPSS
jgi:DNA-binding NarL/FixJ family response regulator